MGFFGNIGCILVVVISLLAGANHIQDADGTAKQILAGQLPYLLEVSGIAKSVPGFKFGTPEAKIAGQVFGGLLVFTSLLIIVGIARPTAAFIQAGAIAFITVTQHLNVKDPAKTTLPEQIQILKNVAIIGGLWVIMSTDSAVRMYDSYREGRSKTDSAANKVKTA
jgi:hypothetical protein